METGPKIVKRGRKPGTATTKVTTDPAVLYLVGIREQTINLLWNIDQVCLHLGIPTKNFGQPKTLATVFGKAA